MRKILRIIISASFLISAILGIRNLAQYNIPYMLSFLQADGTVSEILGLVINAGISLLSCIIMVLAGIFGILGIKPIFRRILGVVLLALTLLPTFMNSVLLGHTGKDLILTAGNVIFYILSIIL